MRRILSTVVIPGLLVVAAAALAQEPVPARIRGTIAAVDSQTLTVTTKGGATETVTLKPGATVNQVVTTKLSEIKPNSFVGVTALPGEGGVMTAVEVHIFPEAARGTGEGHRPWDLYGSDEKTITVPETVPIVTFVPGDIGELVKGAHVVLFGQKAPDGMVTVARIAVGKDGLTPPM
jgi:hypothetical protein